MLYIPFWRNNESTTLIGPVTIELLLPGLFLEWSNLFRSQRWLLMFSRSNFRQFELSTIRASAIRVFGHSSFWPFELMAIRTFGHSSLWPFKFSAIRAFAHLSFPPFELSAIVLSAIGAFSHSSIRPLELMAIRAVGQSCCRPIVMAPVWDDHHSSSLYKLPKEQGTLV